MEQKGILWGWGSQSLGDAAAWSGLTTAPKRTWEQSLVWEGGMPCFLLRSTRALASRGGAFPQDSLLQRYVVFSQKWCVCCWKPALGTHSTNRPAWPLPRGVIVSRSAFHGTIEAVDWLTDENFLPLWSQGEVRRVPSQGACPPAAATEGSLSGTAFKVVTSRTR